MHYKACNVLAFFIGPTVGTERGFCCHARFTVPLSWQHLSKAWQPVPDSFRDRTLVRLDWRLGFYQSVD